MTTKPTKAQSAKHRDWLETELITAKPRGSTVEQVAYVLDQFDELTLLVLKKVLIEYDASGEISDYDIICIANEVFNEIAKISRAKNALPDASDEGSTSAPTPAASEPENAKPEPPPPIDYAKVDAAIAEYTAGRVRVMWYRLRAAIRAKVPAFGSIDAHVERYMAGLGFKACASGNSWRRDIKPIPDPHQVDAVSD